MTTVDIAPLKARVRARERSGTSLVPTVLLAVLVALVAYAAFDQGAGGLGAAARIQVALAVTGMVAAALGIWSGTLRLALSGVPMAGVGLLALFGVWSGASLAWSVAPSQTWTELNRDITYVLVLVLAVTAGASHPRALRLATTGVLAAVVAVTAYALGQKLVPGLHIPGLLNLNRTQIVPRLQDPFGYWNALGLFIALGVPLALALVLDDGRGPRVRLTALLSIEVMLLTIGLTYSRGALLALACGLVVGIGLSRARLRSLMWLATAAVATVPPLVFGLVSHNLTTVSVGLGAREVAGAELLAVVLISLGALWIGGERLQELEVTIQVDAEHRRRIGKAIAVAAGVLLLCGILAVAVSSRGLPGTISHAWHTFTRTQETTNYDPGRLLTADSANRWVWWKEAAGAFSDKPVTGWGAGSFPVVHLLYRRDQISVQQPHSVPLQFLAETGIVGALLAICGFGLLIVAGVRAVRSRLGGERLLAAGMLAAVVMYAVHTFYDWDWDIPGVTFPALVLAGVLMGSLGRQRGQSAGPGPAAAFGGHAGGFGFRAPGLGVRAAALAWISAALCAFALSGILPSLAASRAASALVAASSSSRSVLAHAQATADSATRLNPLSDSGLLASATIAAHLGQLDLTRSYLLQAIKRNPDDVQAWERLVTVEGLLRDGPAVLAAVERSVQLDPMGKLANEWLTALSQRRVPPGASATRYRSAAVVTPAR